MPDFVTIEFDSTSMDGLIQSLRDAADRVDTEATETVLKVGELVKDAAKSIAAQHSTSIPPTIRAEAIPHGVRVRAGSAAAPLAALYDLGNQGKGGRRAKTFRHPVYGNRENWVPQPRYPFFAPARKLVRKQVKEMMGDTWARALEPYTRGSE